MYTFKDPITVEQFLRNWYKYMPVHITGETEDFLPLDPISEELCTPTAQTLSQTN